MKPFFLFLIILTLNNAVAQSPVDVLHYRFHITLSDKTDSIRGQAEIRLVTKTESTSIDFDLTGPDGKKGMGVSAATQTNNNNMPLRFRQEKEKLQVWLRSRSQVGDTFVIRIDYAGIPKDGLIISKTKYGRRSFFADNWPNRGHNWLPCMDHPGDKASTEFIVTAPAHYSVVSNGIKVEETALNNDIKVTHWREDVPIATKVMVIGAAEFATSLAGTVDVCVPVYSYVYPEDRDKGFDEYALAMEVLPYFIKTVGPYGYKKLANVQSKTTFGGLENANTIFYAESSVTGKRKSESLIAHEIAHQWFGNMATEKTFAHLWLSEGFATYMTILYMENKYGKDTARYMLEEDRRQVLAFAKNSNKTVVDNAADYMELLNANSYQKGGWILHMLRHELGDTIFHRAVSAYYAAYAGKNADTEDLQKVFEQVSGKDLSVFFKQWLYTPGTPRIEVKGAYGSGKMTISVKQLQNNVFQFPLDIAFTTNNNVVKHTLQVTQQEQQFTLPMAAKPGKIELDPDMGLLFQGQATYR